MSTSTQMTPDDYAKQWQDELATLGQIQDGSTAIAYCFTTLLPTLMGYYECEMLGLSKTMDVLTECNDYMNDIHRIFNEAATETDPDAYAKDIDEAMADANDLQELLDENATVLGSDTVDDIEKQLSTLFPYGTDPTAQVKGPDGTTMNADQATAENWINAWSVSSSSDYNNGGVNTAQSNADALQPYNDALNDCSNDLSSMSASVNSEFQFYQGEDSQMGSLINFMESQWAQTMQVMTNNQIPS